MKIAARRESEDIFDFSHSGIFFQANRRSTWPEIRLAGFRGKHNSSLLMVNASGSSDCLFALAQNF